MWTYPPDNPHVLRYTGRLFSWGNNLREKIRQFIRFARDGKISDDEIKDFAFISNKLDEISLAIDSLNLWVDKTAGEQGLNIELLREEKKKQK